MVREMAVQSWSGALTGDVCVYDHVLCLPRAGSPMVELFEKFLFAFPCTEFPPD